MMIKKFQWNIQFGDVSVSSKEILNVQKSLFFPFNADSMYLWLFKIDIGSYSSMMQILHRSCIIPKRCFWCLFVSLHQPPQRIQLNEEKSREKKPNWINWDVDSHRTGERLKLDSEFKLNRPPVLLCKLVYWVWPKPHSPNIPDVLLILHKSCMRLYLEWATAMKCV